MYEYLSLKQTYRVLLPCKGVCYSGQNNKSTKFYAPSSLSSERAREICSIQCFDVIFCMRICFFYRSKDRARVLFRALLKSSFHFFLGQLRSYLPVGL
jgi:hypothetical protein